MSCEPKVLQITNNQITASSYHTTDNNEFKPFKAQFSEELYWRPSLGADGVEENMPQNQWIQVDFKETVIMTGIQTQGSNNSWERFTTKLQVQVGDSLTTLTNIIDLEDSDEVRFRLCM